MTKKDYELIADIIGNCVIFANSSSNTKSLTDLFVERLQKENPKFDEYKFKKAVFATIDKLIDGRA